MKKVFLAIVIALFSVTAFGAAPGQDLAIYAQKKGGNDKKEKKDPPGPPVVKEKAPKDKDERPKKDKKPD